MFVLYTAEARFQHHGSCGDLLEFSVTYLTTEGTCFMQLSTSSTVPRACVRQA